MHTVLALLCFVVVIHWLIFPYPSGLLHWHCGNLTIAPVPAKQPWWIWINTSCEFIMNDCITTTKQSTTKPCAYFLGYTVYSAEIFKSAHHAVRPPGFFNISFLLYSDARMRGRRFIHKEGKCYTPYTAYYTWRIKNSWWRHQMEAFSALLVLCAGKSPVTGVFPLQRPVTRSFDVLFDLRLNKQLSK